MKHSILLFAYLLTVSLVIRAEEPKSLSVVEIERAIFWVNPGLEAPKVSLYARAISKAANKYEIDPITLVAIAHQESSFRENLPIGKAGELGMLQIQRNWIQNPKFRRAFKNAREKDLKNPVKAFYYAAWILKDLKRSKLSEKLPYWTLYNARKFENRLKYYLRVKRHLTAIETKKQHHRLMEVAKSQIENKTFNQWQPDGLRRNLSETPLVPMTPSSVQPRVLLNQINWHQKALEVLKDQES